MRRPKLTIAAIVLVFFGLSASATSAAVDGRVHGVVADESGGVLPGVTVVASAGDGRVLANGVTDEAGRYGLRALPAAAIRLTFQLEGFAGAVVEVTISADLDAAIPIQRLGLAPRSETVEVHGTIPLMPPPPPAPIVMPPPPRPVVRAVPDHDRDSICGPAKADAATPSFGTIRSRRSHGNGLYSGGDELVIDGGTASGLVVGQNLVARRSYRTSLDRDGAAGEHTAGLLQIVAAEPHAAVAVVIYACDELMTGDWLAPFQPQPVRAPERAGLPEYDRAAKILLTDVDQLIGAPRRLMVIDRGSDNGIRAGQRVTLFRERPGGRGPSVVGDAVVVAVRFDSATIRIQHASDVVAVGDSAAPQRER